MPIVARGVTYRSTNLVQFVSGQVRMAIRLVSGLDSGPRVRGVDTVIPAAAGRVARNRVADGRRIEIEGFVAGTGSDEDAQATDYRDAMEELRALFDPTLAPGELSVLLEDGTVATIDARTMPEEPEWGPDDFPTFRALSVELEAVGDDWAFSGS